MKRGVLNSMTVAESAAELMESRLEAARSGGSGPRPSAVRSATLERPASSRRRGAKKTTGGLKKDASTRAMGARRQTKRDSR